MARRNNYGVCPFSLDACKKCNYRYECPWHWLADDLVKKRIGLPGWEKEPFPMLFSVDGDDAYFNTLPCMSVMNTTGGYKPSHEFFKQAFDEGKLWHNQNSQ